MWLTIVLEQHLLPESNLKIRFKAPLPGFSFQQRECTTSRREFLWKSFRSCRECYQDFASRQDSRRDPGEEFFSWRDPGEHRFLGGILAEIRSGNFSREGSRRENGPPRRDPGELRESWRDPGEIPVPISQGYRQNLNNFFRDLFPTSGKLTRKKHTTTL